jgi:peptidoglycan hydrolase-like protein with peptidoglycan-binding domain
MENAVTHYQSGAGLTATGTVDTATWQALLKKAPAKVRAAPRTAKLPARRYEIPSG